MNTVTEEFVKDVTVYGKPVTQAQYDAILSKINVRRTSLNKGQMAPKGSIFYQISFTTTGKEPKKYNSTRSVTLENEATVGTETIMQVLKDEVIKHFFN
jgi:uncharacterized protein YpuA (DUF1002 family)